MNSEAGPFTHITAVIGVSRKGGTGKTEGMDALEAAFTLGSHRCRLVDVDDSNRGLGRRVGMTNVVKAPWSLQPSEAPRWIASHTVGVNRLLFDLGAGITSAELPIMNFLTTLWRILADGGARIVVLATVSTNTSISASFIDPFIQDFCPMGEVVIVYNNQDGSANYPDPINRRPEPKVTLSNLVSGIQAVRIANVQPLSRLIMAPPTGHQLATGIIARRIYNFVRQEPLADLVGEGGLTALKQAAGETVPLHFVVRLLADATDERIRLNIAAAMSHRELVRADISEEALLSAARDYRLTYARFMNRNLNATTASPQR